MHKEICFMGLEELLAHVSWDYVLDMPAAPMKVFNAIQELGMSYGEIVAYVKSQYGNI